MIETLALVAVLVQTAPDPVWIDTGGGGAEAIATRFARDLKELLERAASASCGR